MSNQNFEVKRSATVYWFAMVDLAVLDDERLTPIEKIVFCILCRYADQRGRESYPSIKALAQKANCSERAVQNAIKKLIELGLIKREKRFDEKKGGRQTTSVYKIVGFEASCYGEQEENGGCNTCTPTPRTSCTGGGESGAPRTIPVMNNNIYYSNEGESLPKITECESTNEADIKEKPISDKPKTEKTVVKAENSNPEEHFAPKAAPSIMQPTARYLLQRTGRKYLSREEVLALRELATSQMPARVQKEIDRACERFMRQNKPLSSLRFEYIASALRNQPTFGKKKKSKAERDKLKKDCEELKPKEIIKPTNDEEFNAMLARIETLQNQTRGDNQA